LAPQRRDIFKKHLRHESIMKTTPFNQKCYWSYGAMHISGIQRRKKHNENNILESKLLLVPQRRTHFEKTFVLKAL
jgi:hypothetical protein